MPFIIECQGKRYYWANSKEDDFLRFLPGHFDCTPDEIGAYHFDDKHAKKISRYLGDEPMDGAIDLSEQGKLKVGKLKREQVIPPELKEGDDDPAAPGKKVKANDPRTKEKRIPASFEVAHEFVAKKLARWPYENDEHGNLRFLGNQVEGET